MNKLQNVKYPRRGPRSVEIPFMFDNFKEGNVLNIGGAMGSWRDAVLNRKHSMTIIDSRKIKFDNPSVELIQGDIRDLTLKQVGRYDNIILLSTIEHIGLPLFPGRVARDPRKTQLETFQRCMKFLRPYGHMIVTFPCGQPVDKPKHKMLYSKDMVEDLKKDNIVLKEKYAVCTNPKNNTWITHGKYPDKTTFATDYEKLSNSTSVVSRVICMMVMSREI
jgi:hypothetical protein